MNTFIYKASLIMGLLLLGVGSSVAQSTYGNSALEEGYRQIEIGKALNAMASTGKRPEDFVPPHWKVYARADGDLNRDGINETAMVLQLDLEDKAYVNQLQGAKKIESWGPNTYMIMIVRPLPNKTLEFDGVNYSIGAIPQGDRDEFTIDIKNGVLNVHTSTGGSLRNDETYRFREDPPTGGFLTLIGYDAKSYSVTPQPDSGEYSLSENYLTGERLEKTTTFDKKGNASEKQSKSTFKPEKTEFSETSPRCH